MLNLNSNGGTTGLASQNIQPVERSGITEVVLPDSESLALVFPMLAHLSQQAKDRWFTWFPPHGLSKATLQNFQFNLPNMRMVRTHSCEQRLWYTWEALAEGNNHIVVAHLGKLSDKRMQQLEHAAQVGHCSGLLIRYR